jgi:hypothetical protein
MSNISLIDGHLSDPSERAAAAMKAFGESGTSLPPIGGGIVLEPVQTQLVEPPIEE